MEYICTLFLRYILPDMLRLFLSYHQRAKIQGIYDRYFTSFEMIKPLMHLCLLVDLSFTASLSIVTVSTAVFPKRKPNFAHTHTHVVL